VTINAILGGNEGLNVVNTASTSLILGGANIYTGLTQITNSVIVNHNKAFGSTTGETTLTDSSSSIVLNNGITVTGETLNLRGNGGSTPAGALQTALNATAEWNGAIRLNNGSSRIGPAGTSSVLTLSGVISNGTTSGLPSVGNLVIASNTSATGTVILSAANNYTGTTQVIRGTLKLDGGNDRLPTGTVLDVWASLATDTAIFDLNGRSQTVAGLTRTAAALGSSSATNSSATASVFTINNSAVASTYTGNITGNLSVVKNGTFTQTFSGANTYTGNTSINVGTLALADNASLTFVIGANGVNNGVSGAGSFTIDGDFIFDLTGAAAVNGNSWNIVNAATLTELFGATFNVQGFTEVANVWTLGNYHFSEATGLLTYGTVPEPSTYALLSAGMGALYFLRRRRR
jgi:autotransporter-associated beta strand protein